MATLQNRIALHDGVSPALQRMMNSAELLTAKFERAALAANAMGAAASAAAGRFTVGFGVAAFAVSAVAARMKSVGDMAAAMAGRLGTVGGAVQETAMKLVRLRASTQAAVSGANELGAAYRQIHAPPQSVGTGGRGEPSGETGGVKGALSGVFGQFKASNLLAAGAQAMISVLREAPGKLAKLSDEYSGMVTRLSLVAGGQRQAAALNDQIYYAAQRARGGYNGMADAVSRIALANKDAFAKPEQAVSFVEGIQKMLVIGGADESQQSAALSQVAQGLGDGILQGGELKTITQAAPVVGEVVASYMGVPESSLEELANQGEITADVLKNAVMGSMDEINAKFDTVPKKWSDISRTIEQSGYQAFAPVFGEISRLANTPMVQKMVDGIAVGMEASAMAVMGLCNNIEWLAGVIGGLYAQYQPVFDGLGTALLFAAGVWAIYQAGVLGAAFATGVWAMVTGVAAAVMEFFSMLGFVAEMFYTLGAAETFAAMSASQMWLAILLPVALVIAAIYLIVAVINYFCGTSLSATGMIVGAFYWLGQMLYNIFFVTIWNILVSFAEFLANFCNAPLASLYNLFADIWNGIVELVGRSLNEIIGLINKLPGMEIGFVNWGKGLIDKMTIEGGANYSAHEAQYKSGAFDNGYNTVGELGKRLEKQTNFTQHSNQTGAVSSFLMGRSPQTAQNGESAVGNTTENAGAMQDAMGMGDEDIQYMLNAAEGDAIQQYTTTEVKIDMGGIQQNISSDVDLDGVAEHWVGLLREGMNSAAEAVHV